MLMTELLQVAGEVNALKVGAKVGFYSLTHHSLTTHALTHSHTSTTRSHTLALLTHSLTHTHTSTTHSLTITLALLTHTLALLSTHSLTHSQNHSLTHRSSLNQ